jgi:hypothetical protein
VDTFEELLTLLPFFFVVGFILWIGIALIQHVLRETVQDGRVSKRPLLRGADPLYPSHAEERG